MSLLFKIALVALLHLAFFAAYPETGPFGNYYLAISLLLWTGFTLFLGTAVALARLLSGALGMVLNLAIFFLLGLSLAFTMPQEDKTSVLEKLQNGKYPDRATLNSGMKRFGINLDKEIKNGVKDLGEEAQKAVKKI
ncbi:MAG: hypothetical protein A2285_03900 [Elusimicrobia bacterium RIFOXYA12_FULL_57_11]|nr:MAG: hypothetical protein A2285_03900 [Elusimicrobia bacterium RIFOXYA12_FULL_57_11]